MLLKKHFWLLLMLKTVVLLHILVETMIQIIFWWIESLFEIIYYYILLIIIFEIFRNIFYHILIESTDFFQNPKCLHGLCKSWKVVVCLAFSLKGQTMTFSQSSSGNPCDWSVCASHVVIPTDECLHPVSFHFCHIQIFLMAFYWTEL